MALGRGWGGGMTSTPAQLLQTSSFTGVQNNIVLGGGGVGWGA